MTLFRKNPSVIILEKLDLLFAFCKAAIQHNVSIKFDLDSLFSIFCRPRIQVLWEQYHPITHQMIAVCFKGRVLF